MFTGRVPVYKDGNGRFFLDANGKTFKYILEFLRYNSIKGISLHPYFSGGAGFGSTFGPKENALDLRLLHRDAVHFRLNKLVQELEELGSTFEFGTPGTSNRIGQAPLVMADAGTFGFEGTPQQSVFGNTSSSVGFSFGSAQSQGSLFGSSNPQQRQNKPTGLFGSSQNSQTNQGFHFGTQSPASRGFGSGGQSSGGLFGKANVTQPQGMFGSAKTSQAKQSFSFGTQNPFTTASFQNPLQSIFGSAGGFGKVTCALKDVDDKAQFDNFGRAHAFGGPPTFSGKINVNSGFVKSVNSKATFGMASKHVSALTFGQQASKNQGKETLEKTNPSTEPANETVLGSPLKNPDENQGAFTEATCSGLEIPDEDKDEGEGQVSSGFATDITSEDFGNKLVFDK